MLSVLLQILLIVFHFPSLQMIAGLLRITMLMFIRTAQNKTKDEAKDMDSEDEQMSMR